MGGSGGSQGEISDETASDDSQEDTPYARSNALKVERQIEICAMKPGEREKTFQQKKLPIVPKNDPNPGIARYFGMQNSIIKLDHPSSAWQSCLMEIYEP